MHPAGAFSFREFLGLESPGTENKPTEDTKNLNTQVKQKPDKIETGSDLSRKLDFNEIQKIISVVDENQRKVLLADEEAFRNFIKNEAANKSVLSAAHANKVDQNERNLFIAHRGVENILREIYLRNLIESKIPADFPTEEQLHAYYDNNKDKFTLEKRVHVWQIFLATPNPDDTKAVELTKKKAEAIITDINKNKTDFESAARKYSDQLTSRYRGGYMGLIKISDLKPEIKEPLLALATGKISEPVKTDEGIHILKRGSIEPEQLLGFDGVKDQIKKILENRLRAQLRQAIYKKASETYPVDIQDKTIEEWRLKLRTNISTPNTSAKDTTDDLTDDR